MKILFLTFLYLEKTSGISKKIQALGKHVGKGIFGAEMQVSLVNDGPVTIVIDSRTRE